MIDAIAVLTPDKTLVTQRVATVLSRVVAGIADLLIFIALAIGLMMGLSRLSGLLHLPDVFQTMVTIFIFGVGFFLYFILQEGFWNGRTLGKKLTGIRVVHADGSPISWRSAIFRNILRMADFVPVPLIPAILMIFMTPRSQRAGDLVVGTVVIREPSFTLAFTPAPHKVGTHPLEHLIPSLRLMTMDEYLVFKRLCDRFPYLSPEIQREMIATFWDPFAKKHRVEGVPGVHPIYLMEAVIMKFGRMKSLV